jgi:hypothetical protein
MKIGMGVQAILRLCLRKLRGCNVGITDGWNIFNYSIEMGSGAVICIPSFIKIGSGIEKLIGGDTQTHRQQGDLISLLSFKKEKRKESRLKNVILPLSFSEFHL